MTEYFTHFNKDQQTFSVFNISSQFQSGDSHCTSLFYCPVPLIFIIFGNWTVCIGVLSQIVPRDHEDDPSILYIIVSAWTKTKAQHQFSPFLTTSHGPRRVRPWWPPRQRWQLPTRTLWRRRALAARCASIEWWEELGSLSPVTPRAGPGRPSGPLDGGGECWHVSRSWENRTRQMVSHVKTQLR